MITPGKWKICGFPAPSSPMIIYAGDNVPSLDFRGHLRMNGSTKIAEVMQGDVAAHEQESCNVKAIAALPELIDALHRIIDISHDGAHVSSSSAFVYRTAIDALKAAGVYDHSRAHENCLG